MSRKPKSNPGFDVKPSDSTPKDTPTPRGDIPGFYPQGFERPTVVQRTELTTTQFSGPLPLPQVLEAYERVVPGVAQKWVDWTDLSIRDLAQQRQIENSRVDRELTRNFRLRILGSASGLLIALAALGASVYAFAHGIPFGGMAALLFAIAQLASVFVVGRAVTVSTDSTDDEGQEPAREDGAK